MPPEWPLDDEALRPSVADRQREGYRSRLVANRRIGDRLQRRIQSARPSPTDVDATRHARYWQEAYYGVVMRMALLSLVLGAME